MSGPAPTFGSPYVNSCTDLKDFVVLNNAKPSSAAKAPFQQPRLSSNATIVNDGAASDGKALAVFSRATSASDPALAGAWANGGVQLVPARLAEARYEVRLRFTGGQNTKGVPAELWPVVDHWAACPANSGVEYDIVENQGTATSAASNLHYRKGTKANSKGQQVPDTDPSYQRHIGPLTLVTGTVIDWSTYHVVVFDMLADQLNMTVDGVLVQGYPVTNPLLLPQTAFKYCIQTAMTGSAVSGPSRTTETIWTDYIKIYPRIKTPGLVRPSTPQNLSVDPVAVKRNHATWAVSKAGTYPIAGYNVWRKKHTDSTYVKLNGTLITGLGYDDNDSSLLDNTDYDYEVESVDTLGNTSSLLSDPFIVTTLASGSTSKAIAKISSVSVIGQVITVDISASSGSITSGSLDYGDGSLPDTFTVIPTSPLSRTVQGTGEFPITLSLTNAAGVSTDNSVADIPDPTGGVNDPTSGVVLIQQSDPPDAIWRIINAALLLLGPMAAAALPGISTFTDPDSGGIEWGLPGDTYPRLVLRPDGRGWFGGDGTFDMTVLAPVVGPGSPLALSLPAHTPAWVDGNVANSGASGSGTVSIALPDGIPASNSLAVLGIDLKSASAISTPSGWTSQGSDTNDNGSEQLAVFTKSVTSSDNLAALAITVPSALWAAELGVYTGVSGVGIKKVAKNPATAQKVHPLPVPATPTTNPNALLVGIMGGRFSTSSGRTISAPDSANGRGNTSSTSSSVNNVAIALFDMIQATIGPVAFDPASSGSGLFSVGAVLELLPA